MNKNLSNVAVAVIVILTGLALGMMWGVNRYPYFHGSELEAFAVTARPVVTVLVVVACGVAAYARTLREPLGILVAIGVTQLVVSPASVPGRLQAPLGVYSERIKIAYAVLVWLPHSSFLKQPVGSRFEHRKKSVVTRLPEGQDRGDDGSGRS